MPQIDLNLNRKIFVPKFYPYLFDYSNRYEVHYGGAGSGKSVFVFQKVIIKAINNIRRILVVRKTAKSNANSTFQCVLDILSKWKLIDYCKINKTNYTVRLPNGSVFLFYGCDDSEKIKSISGITDIIIEECSELTLDDVTQLDLRLRAKADNLQIFYMFNPVSKINWTYKRWFAEDSVVDDDTIIIHSTYMDNPFLPKTYIASLLQMQKNNPVYYRIYALGEFASLDKLVFNNFEIKEFNHSSLDGELCVGLDFGFINDTTALVCSIVNDTNKTIHIFKEWGAKGKTNDEIASVITNLGLAKSVIIADAAEPKSIEELKRLGIKRIKPCQKGKDSILHGIQQLQQYHIVIHPDCTQIITEFENYSWKKDTKTGEYVNTPIDDFNHYIDALRYSIQSISNNRLKSISKNLF